MVSGNSKYSYNNYNPNLSYRGLPISNNLNNRSQAMGYINH
jgi:hypothetical protein